jgi:hypothetical protein
LLINKNMPFYAGHKINLGRNFSKERNDKISETKTGVPNIKCRLEISGQKFGRLLVLGFSRMKNGSSSWECQCDCGEVVEKEGSSLVSGNAKSCGCLNKERTRETRYKHGMTKDNFYHNWGAMRYRCKNDNNSGYKDYGGRGIKVCQRWNTFLNFKEDMYEKYLEHVKKYGKKNTSIDRINNSKGYFKENCKWATRKEQNGNTRRSVFIEFNGLKMTMSEWARKIGVDRATLLYRIFKKNWPLDKALKKGTDPRSGVPRKEYEKKLYIQGGDKEDM